MRVHTHTDSYKNRSVPRRYLASLLLLLTQLRAFTLPMILMSLLLAVVACSERDNIDWADVGTKPPLDERFTLTKLGENQISIPKDWWVRANAHNPTFFFISEPEKKALYQQWIDYGYDLNLGDSACNFIRTLRPEFDLVKTISKMDFGFKCAWDMEIKNNNGQHYRTVAFAGYEKRMTSEANGIYASYSAPIKEFEALDGKRIASLLTITAPRDLNDVTKDGTIRKVSSGAVRRLAENGQPRIYEVPGFRLVPAGWALHYDPFSSLEIISPDHQAASSPRYLARVMTIEERQQLTNKGYEFSLKVFLERQQYKKINLEQPRESRFANNKLIGFALKGKATYRGENHMILAFIDPSGAVFALTGPEKTLARLGGPALFITMTQSDPDLLDLKLAMTSEGISSGIARSLSEKNLANDSRSAQQKLNEAWINYEASQVILNSVGGSNGQNW